MTENEAIERMRWRIYTTSKSFGNGIDGNAFEDMETAIKALEEIQQYRELGILEEVRAAVEKQKPKKPYYEGDGYADGHIVYDTWICPNCGEYYEVDYDDYDFCPKCGQKLKRED